MDQWAPAVKSKLAQVNGKILLVPNNMTQHFQSPDLTVNRSYEDHIRADIDLLFGRY